MILRLILFALVAAVTLLTYEFYPSLEVATHYNMDVLLGLVGFFGSALYAIATWRTRRKRLADAQDSLILQLLALPLAAIAAFLAFAVFFELEKAGQNLPVRTLLVHVIFPALTTFIFAMATFLRLRRKGSGNGTGTK